MFMYLPHGCRHGVYDHGGVGRVGLILAHQGLACGGGQLRTDRASFTFLALVTGSLWGGGLSHVGGGGGTYWEWDPRLNSELILLFLYLGYMGLRSRWTTCNAPTAASAVLAVVGVVNVPIIHYSVLWWNSCTKGRLSMKLGKSSMPASMLIPLLVMLLGSPCCSLHAARAAAREILNRERTASWIRKR